MDKMVAGNLNGQTICTSADDLQRNCWVCKQIIRKGNGRIRIEFVHINIDLRADQFNFCPRCGRRMF